MGEFYFDEIHPRQWCVDTYGTTVRPRKKDPGCLGIFFVCHANDDKGEQKSSMNSYEFEWILVGNVTSIITLVSQSS